jgi:hypothetical protein
MTPEELEKIHAEVAMLMATTSKMNTETKWHPWMVVAAYNTVIAALIGALVVLITKH